MNGLLDFLYIFLSFAVGTIYAGKAMRYCIEQKLMGEVNHRSSHKAPTPRGGGYYFVIMISAFSLVWLNVGEASPHIHFLNTLFLSGMAVGYLGWLDDKNSIKASTRFILQLVLALLCVIMLPPVLPEILPTWVEKTLLVLAWVWFLNLYNFMDGIDGIAATQAVFIAIALSLFVPEISPIALVMAGSVLGFLRFNWSPARVFMGDVGSTYLGFILGGLIIYNLTFPTFEKNLWVGLILTLVFTADTTYTLIKRTLQGKKPWEAHNEHFYQRAVKMGMSHAQVVKRVIALNLVLLVLAILAKFTTIGAFLFIAGLVMLVGVALRIRHLEGK